MSEVKEFASLLAAHQLASISSSGEMVLLTTLSSLERAIRENGATAVHSAFRETLVRLGETHILSDPRFQKLIEVWDSLIGTARDRIEGHLTSILGASPSAELVSYVYKCLSGSAAQRGRHSGDHNYAFEDVSSRVAKEFGKGAGLRCECCGYHFRVKDLRQDRVKSVIDAGLTLETSLFPGRADDPYKPTIYGKDSQFTRLSLDHVIPEETLGWSDADNLKFLCMFCNMGKQAFHRPLEAISSFAIGALAEVPHNRSFSSLKHQIIVAALRSQGGQCSKCGGARDNLEITVRPIKQAGGGLPGFSPWNLSSVCYKCLANDISEVQGDTNDEDFVLGAEQEFPGISAMERLE